MRTMTDLSVWAFVWFSFGCAGQDMESRVEQAEDPPAKEEPTGGVVADLFELRWDLARISHTHKKHRSPGDVKFMYGMNLTRFPTEDRCPHTVSPFRSHFKGARGAG